MRILFLCLIYGKVLFQMVSLFDKWNQRKSLRETFVSPGMVVLATPTSGLFCNKFSLWTPSPYPHISSLRTPTSYHHPTTTSYYIPTHDVSPVWMSGTGLNDQDKKLLLDYLGSSVRESTRKCYFGYWNGFKRFVQKDV